MGTRADFATVMDSIFAGNPNPVLDHDFPLEEAPLAQERLEKGEQLGKNHPLTLTSSSVSA